MSHDLAARPGTRERILRAAADLIYDQGIAPVSIDDLTARAGISRKTFYNHFRSKDDLITAYLEARMVEALPRYRAWAEAAGDDASASQQIVAMLRGMAGFASQLSCRGCGFARVSAELAHLPGHPAHQASSRMKHALEDFVRGKLSAAGEAPARRLARQIAIMMEGLAALTVIHRDPSYFEDAILAVTDLLAPYEAALADRQPARVAA